MNFFNLLFLGKYGNYHKTNWFEALFAKVVGAGRKLIAKFLKIKGNTIVWNQLIQNGNFADTSIWQGSGATVTMSGNVMTVTKAHGTPYGTGYAYQRVSMVAGHKYLESIDIKVDEYTTTIRVFKPTSANITPIDTNWHTISRIESVTTTGQVSENVWNLSENTDNDMVLYARNCVIIDLTAMFGSTKADEIYAMEQSQIGSGVAYFRSLFPLPYYQYTEGKLLSFGTPQQVTWNQLVDAPQTSGDFDVQGVNLTYGTNTITLNSGTASSNIKVRYNNYDLTSGHKYAVWGSPKKSNVNNYYLYIADSTGNTSRKAIFAEPEIYDCQVTENARLYVHVEKGITANHNVFQPQIVDLTVMYGSGKEPSIEYFKQNYSGYYPYDSGSTVSANVSGIKTVGKNLFDGIYNNLAFANTVVQSPEYRGYTLNVSALKGKEITISRADTTSNNRFRVAFFSVEPQALTPYEKDLNNGIQYYNYDGNLSFTLTVPQGANYFLLYISNNSTEANNLMIEIGSTATTYEPYQSSTTSIPISTYFPNGMMGRGTAFDEIDLVNGKAYKRMGLMAFNGSEEWAISTNTNPNGNLFQLNDISVPFKAWESGGRDSAMSNLFEKASNTGSQTSESDNTFWWNNARSGVRVVCGTLTLEQFKAKLQSTPLQVIGELATEQVVNIDPPLNLSYQVWENGTEQLLPINTDSPTTSPILADIKYPDGERDNQYFTYRQYLPNSRMMSMALNTIMGKSVEFNQQALDILMKGE